MVINTLSICLPRGCNAKCPFCISKLTTVGEQSKLTEDSIKYDHNFMKVCRLAQIGGISSVLITGKGEPLLYPNLIDHALFNLREDFDFPFIDLQTNGLILFEKMDDEIWNNRLDGWWFQGLTTISISVAHYDPIRNSQIYTPGGRYMSIPMLVQYLHKHRFQVRLNCTLVKDYIDSVEEVLAFIRWCKEIDVDQVSIRPVRSPAIGENKEVYEWTKAHELSDYTINKIHAFFEKNATPWFKFAHGAIAYDYEGMNVCLTDCLTRQHERPEELRQVILMPDGSIAADWALKGAKLLR